MCSSEEAIAENFEEGPVQGPLPLEPDDAPWKRSIIQLVLHLIMKRLECEAKRKNKCKKVHARLR